jgi:hypothetical protein
MYDPIGVPVAVVQPDGTYALREVKLTGMNLLAKVTS